jgi:hypothetical protein
MDLKAMWQSVTGFFHGYPVLIVAIVLAAVVSIIIMVDAHHGKKKRSRHRWK